MKPKKTVNVTLCATTTTYELEIGELHREDGPAFIQQWSDGDYYEAWFYDDVYHRYGGPAKSNHKGEYDYWIHGNVVTAKVIKWLSDMGYAWETMNVVEKWELDMFMRSL